MRRLLLASAFIALALSAQAQQATIPELQIGQGVWEPIGPNGLSVNSTVVENTGTGTTGAAVIAMPAVALKTNYVCGISIEAGASAATDGTATLAGLTNTLSFIAPVAASTSGQLNRNFTPCIPASAVNTAITLTGPTAGAGGSSTVSIWGFVR